MDFEDTDARFDDELKEEDLEDLDELEDLDLSLKWVSRCCFILSARVNFL